MEKLYEKLYLLYINTLSKLSNGYPISESNFSRIWELIQLIYFMSNSDMTDDEFLFIIDKYENY